MDFHNHSLNQQESEERRIMSLNEETCWNDPSFCQYWDEVYAIVEDEYGVPDEGWQLDVILECYQKEGSVADAAADIHDGYDPTPQTAYEFFH